MITLYVYKVLRRVLSSQYSLSIYELLVVVLHLECLFSTGTWLWYVDSWKEERNKGTKEIIFKFWFSIHTFYFIF